MGKWSETLDASFEWTSLVLFRPFRLKKWMILGFIALMSGALAAGGGRFNLGIPNFPPQDRHTHGQYSGSSQEQTSVAKPPPSKDFLSEIKAGIIKHLSSIIFAGLLVLLISSLCLWLGARFRFIFLDSILKNDASIALPFRRYRESGDSLFAFRLAYVCGIFAFGGVLVLLCLVKLSCLGVFVDPEKIGFGGILWACLPYLVWLIIFWFCAAIVDFIVNNFVVIVMYRAGCGFIEGWKKAALILEEHGLDTIKFALLKIAVNIASGIAYVMIMLVPYLILCLVLIMGIILGSGLFHLLPSSLHIACGILLGVIFVPLLLVVVFCMMCAYLPFAVFQRTLSVKYIARIEPRYNLFMPSVKQEVSR